MQKELLRLIYQRRFKLMNRWHAGAMVHQPKFGASGLLFRSFIFNAFENLIQLLRRDVTRPDAERSSLAEQYDFGAVPDPTVYRGALEIGIDVLGEFIRQEPACRTRFPDAAREKAFRALKEAGEEFLQTESEGYKRRYPGAKEEPAVCMQCGRPLPG